MAVDGVFRDQREHFAILFAQRSNGMYVATAKAVSNAIEARAHTHQQGLPFGKHFQGLFNRGSGER